MSNGHKKHPWRLAIAAVSLLLVLGLSPSPVAVSQAPGYVEVSAGSFHTCAIREHYGTAGGEVNCWGLDDDGQATAPAGEFTQVSAGGYHTCGLRADGHVVCWGSNRVFLGCDEFDCYYENTWQATPPPDVVFTQVSAGVYHTCGVKLDGGIDCWGWNDAGEAADHAGSYLLVSAGEYHTCGLRTDGHIECWGDDANGRAQDQIGPFTDVSVGGSHNCAVSPTGSATCWGGDWYGQSSPPSNVSFLAATAGNLHSCGLTSAHALLCWGYNFYGQVRQAPQGYFTQVSSGQGHSCAISGTHEVYCWGRDNHGQATVPAFGDPAVRFDFEGFYPPVKGEPALNAVKAGSAVSLKFSLGGDWGLNVIDLGAPTSGLLDCDLLDSSGEFEPVQSVGAGLTYDPDSDQYTYVWKTEKAWAGTCRVLSLQLVDGTEHLAAFQFK